jgi:hypothetical protein
LILRYDNGGFIHYSWLEERLVSEGFYKADCADIKVFSKNGRNIAIPSNCFRNLMESLEKFKNAHGRYLDRIVFWGSQAIQVDKEFEGFCKKNQIKIDIVSTADTNCSIFDIDKEIVCPEFYLTPILRDECSVFIIDLDEQKFSDVKDYLKSIFRYYKDTDG